MLSRLLLLFALCLISCVSGHRGFEIYKRSARKNAGTSYPIRGVYFITDLKMKSYYDPPFAIYLHDDGTVNTFDMHNTSTIPDEKFWTNPEEYMKNVKFNVAHGQGNYVITDNTITIETLGFKGGIPQQGVNRFDGQIRKDSTIQLSTQICEWCPERFAEEYSENPVRQLENVVYRFYRTSIRPDSTFWFHEKKWYRKGIRKGEIK